MLDKKGDFRARVSELTNKELQHLEALLTEHKKPSMVLKYLVSQSMTDIDGKIRKVIDEHVKTFHKK